MIKHPVMTDKPPSIIPRNMIAGVRERTDYKGAILAAIDEAEIRDVGQKFAGTGTESIGVCFLWSFQNRSNEQKVREIIRTSFPNIFVTLSHELAPFPGEYERVSTVALNARLSPIVTKYLDSLRSVFASYGFKGTLLVMQGYGGLLTPGEAATRAVGVIESGPAGGVIGSQFMGRILGTNNIIACDMGGTSFKVGVITSGLFDHAVESLILRYHYSVPKIDITSIGAGGGSIIWIDPRTSLPRVGPQSAGSMPGPICYDLGGEEPTITDVDLMLGYIDPNFFLGGRMKLSYEKAAYFLEQKVAKPLGMRLLETASRAYELVCSQMSDLIHKVTVEKGLDPREYVLFAYGGAASMHAAEFARELQVQKVVVPMTASVHGAFGAVSSDVVHEHIATRQMTVPPDLDTVNEIFDELENRALRQLLEEGHKTHQTRIERSITLKFRLQVYALDTPFDAKGKLSEKDLQDTYRRFEELYEQKHGKGSAYKEAGMEIVSFRLKAIGEVPKPVYRRQETQNSDTRNALMGERTALFRGKNLTTKFYNYNSLNPGNVVEGPSVILTPVTTIVVPPSEVGRMDEYRNIVIEFGR